MNSPARVTGRPRPWSSLWTFLKPSPSVTATEAPSVTRPSRGPTCSGSSRPGLRAPSGKNGQTTRFVHRGRRRPRRADRRPTRRQHGHPAGQGLHRLHHRPSSPRPSTKGTASRWRIVRQPSENMLLAVTGLGYATVWIDGWLRVQDPRRHHRQAPGPAGGQDHTRNPAHRRSSRKPGRKRKSCRSRPALGLTRTTKRRRLLAVQPCRAGVIRVLRTWEA